MSDNTTISGWNSTDDDTVVPVRSNGNAVQSTEEKAVQGPAQDIGHSALPDVTIHATEHAAAPSARGMTMSAVLGVLIAVGGIVAYLGLDIGSFSLTGELLGSQSLTVTITEDGNFSPDTLEIHPGDTVTIENKNADPQVIKTKNNRDLFPVQVIFDEPYTFTVSDDAVDTYVYFSETLPEDRTVTFTVSEATPASSESSSDGGIPLPFGGGDPIESQVSSSVSSSLRPATQTVEHSDETATITLGGSTSSSSSTSGIVSVLPTNPYTVESGLSQQQQMERIASSASSTETLHSGAPIKQLVMHTPKTVTQTGPAEMMLALLFIPSLAGVFILARKLS